VLVVVTVKTVESAQAPQFFRIRITVHQVGDGAKISDVAFVS
jgi:hypothetical protein